MYAATEDDGVFRSTNNGVSWSAFNTGLEGIAGREERPHRLHQRHDGLRGHQRGPVQVRRAAAASSRSRRVLSRTRRTRRSSTQAVQAVFTGILPGQPDARRRSPAAASTSPPTAARPGSRRRRATAWCAAETRLEPRLLQGQRRADLRGDAERHLHLDRLRLQLDAVQRRHHRHHAARLGRRQVPEHLLRRHHRRPLPLGQPSASPGTGISEDTTGPRDHAVQRHQRPSASTPPPTTASSRARPTCDPLPGQGHVAQAHDHRDGAQHGGLGPQQLHQHARHVARRHARWRRQGAGPHAAGLGRRQAHRSSRSPRSSAPSSRSATNGTWTGTPTIEFTYQWQDCTAAVHRHQGRDRVLVRDPHAEPQVPRRGHRAERLPARRRRPARDKESDVTSASGPKPGTLPGDNQSSTGSIKLTPAGQPQPGTILTAQNWLFNPAATTSTSFQWFRCVGVGNCDKLEGATGINYTIIDQDVGKYLCVAVTGQNPSGSTTLGCTGLSGEVLAPDPKQTSAADDRRQRLGRPHVALRRRPVGLLRHALRASLAALRRRRRELRDAPRQEHHLRDQAGRPRQADARGDPRRLEHRQQAPEPDLRVHAAERGRDRGPGGPGGAGRRRHRRWRRRPDRRRRHRRRPDRRRRPERRRPDAPAARPTRSRPRSPRRPRARRSSAAPRSR